MDNLLASWQEFLCGKRKRKDVAKFSFNLMDNILNLQNDLKTKLYTHGRYEAFKINDPKPRNIHKASVRDRLLHHAIYRTLYSYFDKKFIFDSYSCRKNKGTHKALERFKEFAGIVSKNNTRTAFVLKGDVRKFFNNIDHKILKNILKKDIKDTDALWLLDEVIGSFSVDKNKGKGLPLGNLTSQLLVNVYMNKFDHFIKRELKCAYYIRYADDFVILSENKQYLKRLIPQLDEFLKKELKLELHPDKLFIKTFTSGVDFLGWVHFPNHRVLRTATKRRMLRNLKNNRSKESLNSYLGLIKHGDSYKLSKEVENIFEKNETTVSFY